MADETLIRVDPAKSSLEECITQIAKMEESIEALDKPDAALLRELRAWHDRRLEIEDRVASESAQVFFPPNFSKAEILELVEDMRVRAEALPD